MVLGLGKAVAGLYVCGEGGGRWVENILWRPGVLRSIEYFDLFQITGSLAVVQGQKGFLVEGHMVKGVQRVSLSIDQQCCRPAHFTIPTHMTRKPQHTSTCRTNRSPCPMRNMCCPTWPESLANIRTVADPHCLEPVP